MSGGLIEDIDAYVTKEKQRLIDVEGLGGGVERVSYKRFKGFCLDTISRNACGFIESVGKASVISITETIDTSPAAANNIITVWYWRRIGTAVK